jgi:periplasmic protein TonB
MEPKKHLRFNLEKRRNSLLFTGLTIALASVLVAFEYRTFEPKEVHLAQLDLDFMQEEEIVSISFPKPTAPPPPPKAVIDQYIINDIPEADPEPEALPELIPVEIDPKPEVLIIEGRNEIPDETPIPYFLVEEMPTFPGGDSAMHEFLRNKIKMPQMAKDARVNGKIFVEFTIDKEGNVEAVELRNHLGYGCDEVAFNAVKQMPKWNPGKQQTKPVKVRMRLPIAFKTK